MKKLVSLTVIGLLAAGLTVPARAEIGWSQTNAPITAPGEVTYVDLQLGDDSSAGYRMGGEWEPRSSKVMVLHPTGAATDISDTLFSSGSLGGSSAAGGYIASFNASAVGAYVISAEEERITERGGQAVRTLRSAKSFTAVGDIPTWQRVKSLNGFNRPVSADRAELIPFFNPAAVTPNEAVEVQLLVKDKPLADTGVKLIRRSTSDEQLLTTDGQGVVRFMTGPADYYLLYAQYETGEKEDGRYEATRYDAAMTFTVQRGIQWLPAKHPEALPVTCVDGKDVGASGLQRSADGTLLVDSAFIREAVNSGFKEKGLVGLRAAVEGSGGRVEYLAPVGDMNAAVYIYTPNK
ncbi:DUF4198 domain-containing protein [Paenibacillus sp. y28]|uniref:DUF4198 domain-containing protein n=1 Tax=Paenibacillus sp. y28 TaxID=3129110 RepID=UPI0030199F94